MNKKRLIRIVTILILGLGIAAAIAAYQIQNEKNNRLSLFDTNTAPIVAKDFGGPFTLTNQDNKTVTQNDFEGKKRLIYFGFTFCPAICPTELQKISAALNNIGDQASDITPIFITVDPERDTVDVMRQYVELFHPSFIGLTGTLEQIEQAKNSYKIYAAKVKDDTMTEYTMDHSSFIYYIDENDDLRRIFKVTDTAEDITTFLKNNL